MTTNYKKELYSLPLEIVNELIAYAKETKQKKSHIVAEYNVPRKTNHLIQHSYLR